MLTQVPVPAMAVTAMRSQSVDDDDPGTVLSNTRRSTSMTANIERPTGANMPTGLALIRSIFPSTLFVNF